MGAQCWLEMDGFPDRKRFHVEPERGSLYIKVSWNKLQKLVPTATTTTNTNADSIVKHGLEAEVAAHKDSRINAVIEKIERLYQGDSGDDDEQDVDDGDDGGGDGPNGTSCKHPDDEYDTDDTFIDDLELDEYFEVNRTKTKHSGFYINKGTLEKKVAEGKTLDETSGLKVYKKRQRPVNDKPPPPPKKAKSDDEATTKALVISTANKTGSKMVKSAPAKLKSCSTKVVPLSERSNGLSIDAAAAAANANNIDDFKTPPKDSSPGRKSAPKLTMLDRAIQELEKEVADRCPASTEKNHENENKKRIPKEVKARLAKVARIAQKQNKLSSDEFLDALMRIMGHLMQLRTLKRNLKEMVELGLSAQKEKQSKLETVKNEIVDMVKARISQQQLAQENSEFQESNQRVYPWDAQTEDRINDLYELYIEGIDEHKSAATKKFYAELAEIWPEGWMDNNGIKNAVLRSKERKREALKQAKVEERKRKITPKVAKKQASLLHLLPDHHHQQDQFQQQQQIMAVKQETEVERSCSVQVMSLVESNSVLGSNPARDCPAARNGGVVAAVAAASAAVPSSLRQIKRTLLDKTSNRSCLQSESYCCNTESITPPSSLVWMVKDPKPA